MQQSIAHPDPAEIGQGGVRAVHPGKSGEADTARRDETGMRQQDGHQGHQGIEGHGLPPYSGSARWTAMN